MQALRLVFIAAALLAVVGQYLQEMRRLAIVKRLSGPQARDYYERTRERREKLLAAVTVGLAVMAIAAVVSAFVLPR